MKISSTETFQNYKHHYEAFWIRPLDWRGRENLFDKSKVVTQFQLQLNATIYLSVGCLHTIRLCLLLLTSVMSALCEKILIIQPCHRLTNGFVLYYLYLGWTPTSRHQHHQHQSMGATLPEHASSHSPGICSRSDRPLGLASLLLRDSVLLCIPATRISLIVCLLPWKNIGFLVQAVVCLHFCKLCFC